MTQRGMVYVIRTTYCIGQSSGWDISLTSHPGDLRWHRMSSGWDSTLYMHYVIWMTYSNCASGRLGAYVTQVTLWICRNSFGWDITFRKVTRLIYIKVLYYGMAFGWHAALEISRPYEIAKWYGWLASYATGWYTALAISRPGKVIRVTYGGIACHPDDIIPTLHGHTCKSSGSVTQTALLFLLG